MAGYDVFISCKSEDYPLAEDVYSFLTENHISVFLASKELRKLGDAEYREAIEDALESAEHLIVLASDAAFIKSKWVKYEWGLFLNAKIDGYKKGNVITVLKDIRPQDIAFALRRYESFPFKSFRDSIINYVETDESRSRALAFRQKKEKEAEIRRRKEEESKRIRDTQVRLIRLAEEYKKECSGLEVIAAKIRATKKSLGINEYVCPVCSTPHPLDADSCRICGWRFHPAEGIKGAEYLIEDKAGSITLSRKIYEAYLCLKASKEKTGSLESELRESLDNIQQLHVELSKRDFQVKEMHEKLNELSGVIGSQKREIANYRHSYTQLNKRLDESRNEINDRKTEIERLEQENRTLKNVILIRDKRIDELSNQLLSQVTSAATAPPVKYRYSVWILFATKGAEEVVRQYNPSFTSFPKDDDGQIKRRTNFHVGSFGTIEEAEELKNKLELKGATVVIRTIA